MMILITLPKPEKGDKLNAWSGVVSILGKEVQSISEVEILSENTLLIHGANGLRVFGRVVSLAVNSDLSYKVIFIEKFTEWNSRANT